MEEDEDEEATGRGAVCHMISFKDALAAAMQAVGCHAAGLRSRITGRTKA